MHGCDVKGQCDFASRIVGPVDRLTKGHWVCLSVCLSTTAGVVQLVHWLARLPTVRPTVHARFIVVGHNYTSHAPLNAIRSVQNASPLLGSQLTHSYYHRHIIYLLTHLPECSQTPAIPTLILVISYATKLLISVKMHQNIQKLLSSVRNCGHNMKLD